MVNILYYAEELHVGGVEKMMLQWVECRDPDIHIDVFVRKVVDDTMRQRFISAGCEVFEADCSVRNLIRKARELSIIFKRKKYDIVHIHTSLATDFFVLMVAKRHGIKHRITHSHNVPIIPRFTTRWADKICKPLLRHYSTNYFGCSKQAAIALFGNKKKYLDRYVVVKNGIDTDLYRFSAQNRADIRKEFGISEDDYVIGSVGRMDFQKNYGYLLKIVSKLTPDMSKVTLLIIGDGYERDALKEYADAHNIRLLMPGKRSDANKIYSCFDLFVLTSRYEGFPVVMMEAQANGVDCLVSEAIPEEAVLNDNVERVSLGDTDHWMELLNKHICCRHVDEVNRICRNRHLVDEGYEINTCAKELIQFYSQIAK